MARWDDNNNYNGVYTTGKTISVSLFAAAILFSAPGVECSIYSTCKRISQKLLRNVKKFLDLVYIGMDVQPFKILRSNCEELVIQGQKLSKACMAIQALHEGTSAATRAR